MVKQVQILLATYNGALFLEEQLNSILAQDYQDWEILTRDDGSADDTVKILNDFKSEYSDKIKIIDDGAGNRGHCQNFATLMESSTAPIISFCDQDDIWHFDKLSRSVDHLQNMQDEYGTNVPILVHHDFATIDADGYEMQNSYNESNKAGKDDNSLNHILLQNTVTGFASVANRALVDNVCPMHKGVRAHDLYVGLVAASLGKICYVPDQLADYRIHGDNAAGGKNPFYNLSLEDFSLDHIFNGHSVDVCKGLIDRAHEMLEEKCDHASYVLETFGDEISEENRAILEDFSKLPDASFFEKRALILKNNFLPKSLKMALGFLALG